MFETGFDRFWAAWTKNPRKGAKQECSWTKNPRKGAKQECSKKWKKYYCETHVDQILKHVEWMKTTDQWRKDNGAFIPAPLVYLNGQRWDGAEIPEVTSTVHVRDPYLVKLDEERKNFVPMSDEMRQKIQALIKKG